MCNSAKRHDHRVLRQRSQFIGKEPVTRVHLGTHRLVAGWQALDRIRYAAIDEGQAIVGGLGMIAARKAIFVQHLIQENARVIPGKRPPRSIGAMHAWREPNNQETRVGGAERWHGTAVIVRETILYVIEKPREPRAVTTLFVEYRRVDQAP